MAASSPPATERLPPVTLRLPILLAAVVPACSPVGPDYEGAPDTPTGARFANADGSKNAPALDRWWTQLGDSRVNRLVEAALRNNLEVRIAQERWREARSLRKQAGATFLPQVSGDGGFTHFDLGRGDGGITGEIAQSGFLTDPQNYWSANADVSWELDLFGGRRREVEAATARAEAAREELHATRLAIVSETVDACQSLAGLQEQLRILANQVDGQASQLEDMEERLAVGAASELDVDRSKARLEDTRALLPPVQAGISSQQRRLMVLLGDAGSAIDSRILRIDALPRSLPMVRTGLPAELMLRRPDLRRAERELAAATADLGVATANFYPRFFLLGSPTASTRKLGDLFDAVSYDWQVGPAVRWSLFSGGQNRAVLEGADARHKQALLRYQDQVVKALQEVESELANLRSETQRLALVQRARTATARSVARVRDRYEAGAADHLDLLSEEERLREVEITEIRVKSQVALVWTRLHKALGGGWK